MTALAAILLVGGAAGALAASLFRRPRAGVVVAVLVATMPLVVTQAHEAWRSLIAIAAFLGWLGAVAAFERTRRWTWLALAGAALGVATAGTGAAAVTAPLLLGVTVIALMTIDDGAAVSWPVTAVPALAFLIAVAPFLIYLAINPQWYFDRIRGYGLYDASRFNVLQGAREITSWVGLTARSETYWHYFDPSFLFLSGRTLADALTAPRVFLLPFAVWLPLGAVGVFSRLPPRTATALVAWLLLSPAAGALILLAPDTSRLILMAPPAALLAYVGIVRLRTAGHRGLRILGTALVVLFALHAAAFVLTALR